MSGRHIPIAEPDIGPDEIAAVTAAMEAKSLAQGSRVAEFEERFAEFMSVKHAVAVNSGTAALHTALLALGVGPGDEVITSSFSFIASGNSILYTGAKPVFADIREEDFNIDPAAVEAAITPKTKAVMPVHLFGQPCDMEIINDICLDRGLALVEDTCQSHGATYRGLCAGTFGTGCFSFYPTKNMTTGEGGMLTTDDAVVADKARLVRAHGMKVRYHHETLGYNYRMTDMGAAIGLVQLEKLVGYNDRRFQNAMFLNEQLADVKGLVTPSILPDRTHVFHQYTVRITPEFALKRDDFVKALGDRGIGNGIYYPIPIHRQQVYLDLGYKVNLPVTDMMAEEVVSLPVHPNVGPADLERIAAAVKEIANG
ncbi:MAG: DegT/DnrJ/EryC1/StrS family aminotransferase [Actinomycetota bacterium]